MALGPPSERPPMPQSNGSTSSLVQPHIPGQYPSSTPTYEHNYSAASLEGGAPDAPLTGSGVGGAGAGAAAPPADEARSYGPGQDQMGQSAVPLADEGVEPIHSNLPQLGQEEYTIDPVLLQKSMQAAETQSYQASVPNNPNFHSRFVEDLPESLHSRDDDRINSTVHLHEPVVGEGEIPAALALQAQDLAKRQASALPPADPSKDHKNWDDSALQQTLADDERQKAEAAAAAEQSRPEAHQIGSTQTVRNAPLAAPHLAQSDNATTPVIEEPEAEAAQPQQAPAPAPMQDPNEVRARELAMVTPATVTVSAAALEQLSQAPPVGKSPQFRQEDHPKQLQPGPRDSQYGYGHRQHQPVHLAGMAAPVQPSYQQQQQRPYEPAREPSQRRGQVPDSSIVQHTPSQRKAPPAQAAPVLMSGYFTNGEPTHGPNKASQAHAAEQHNTQQQNYRDSIFNSMSGVPDPTSETDFKPNQSLGQNRSLRSVFGAPIGMDDQRASVRSTPRLPAPANAENEEGEEEEDHVQPLHPAVLPRSKSQRTSRTYNQDEPIQRSRSKLNRSQSSASRRTRASVAPSVASRRSALPESWWSKTPEGTNKRNGPLAFQVEKVGMLPCSWWEKPSPAKSYNSGRNSVRSRRSQRYADEEDSDDDADSTDSDGPAPSRTYSTAGVQRRKSLLPESYWSDKPKPAQRSASTRSRSTRPASRRSRPHSQAAYSRDAAEEGSTSDEEAAAERAATPRAASRAQSVRSRRSHVEAVEGVPRRTKSVRSNRTSVRDGAGAGGVGGRGSRPVSRTPSKLTRSSSRRRQSRAAVDDEEDYEEAQPDYATAGMPSRSASRRSKADTMGQPSTATGFSSANTSRSRLARGGRAGGDNVYGNEDDEEDGALGYPYTTHRPRTPVHRGEEPYTAA